MKYSISVRFQLHGLFIISSEIVGIFDCVSFILNVQMGIATFQRWCVNVVVPNHFRSHFTVRIFQRRPMCPRIYLIFLFLIEWLQIIRNATHHLYFMSVHSSHVEKAKQMSDVFQQLNSSRKLNHALHLLFFSIPFIFIRLMNEFETCFQVDPNALSIKLSANCRSDFPSWTRLITQTQ